MTELTAVPWSSSSSVVVCALSAVVFGRVANSGWVRSTPESTTVTGLPAPGESTRSDPIAARHHSSGTSGSVACCCAVAKVGKSCSVLLTRTTPARRSLAISYDGTRQIRSAWTSSVPPAARANWTPLWACAQLSSTRSARAGAAATKNRARAIRSLGAKCTQSSRDYHGPGMVRAFVGLGSNLGERRETLRAAIGRLRGLPEVEVKGVSSFRDTEPLDYLDQPRFLNGAVELETELSARALLGALLELERAFGRDRTAAPPHGPRTLDLDLLLYGDATIDEPFLKVPHPRLQERRFALEPLAELDPDLEVPGQGSVQSLLARLDSSG